MAHSKILLEPFDKETPISLNELKLEKVGLEVGYPSEWFDKHIGKKPLLNIHKTENIDLKNLAHNAKIQITSETPNLNIIMAFLFDVFIKYPMKLNANWESFGVKIGNMDADITINNLVDVTRTEQLHGIISGTVTEGEYEGIVVASCTFYRLSLLETN